MTSIFQNGRGFVYGPIFLPSTPYYETVNYDSDRLGNKNALVGFEISRGDPFLSKETSDSIAIVPPIALSGGAADYRLAARQAYEQLQKKKSQID